jgi:NADH-quinone oxidoreductase subunit N
MQQSIAYQMFLVAPLLILTLGALVVLLLDGFRVSTNVKGGVTIATLLIAALGAAAAGGLSSPGQTAFNGFIYVDPFSVYMNVILLFGSLLALLLGFDRLSEQGVEAGTEYYALLLFSTAGAMVFVGAAELITLFVGLEIMSMALYALCGSALKLRRSAESALKYFLLGSFSSAFLLYGIALLYGLTGTLFISKIAVVIGGVHSPLLMVAMGLMLVGLVFKIGAVPFHFWAPDVYEGAPTSITAYMACVIKAAAFAASLRILWVAFEQVQTFWVGAVWTIAVLTMTLGNLVALRQRSLKRMLAYSSISHAGYMMVAFLAPGDAAGGGAAILYYLVAYTLMTMGAFGVVLAVTSSGGPSEARNHDDITRFNGLGTTKPLLAAAMALFMLSLAGIPPGLSGLLGKFYIFGAAIRADYVGIVIIGVVNSAISCYYYLRVIVAMYFVEADAENAKMQYLITPSMASVLCMCALGVVLFGVFPSLLHDSAAFVMMGFSR